VFAVVMIDEIDHIGKLRIRSASRRHRRLTAGTRICVSRGLVVHVYHRRSPWRPRCVWLRFTWANLTVARSPAVAVA
jgi:hypothetical protein